MNLPNLLTLSRFALIPLFLVLYLNGYSLAAVVIVLLSGATDILDGYLARRSGKITQAGMMLDPLADKLMMLSIVTALLIKDVIPWSAVAVMAVRELGMIASSAFFHFRGLKTVPANLIGKATTVVNYAAILMLLLGIPGGLALLWTGIALSLLATAIYIFRFRRLNHA
mgnify:CR=1 FL=1